MNLNIELFHSNFKSQTCPNCGEHLNKLSKRKFTCPYCKKDIYYRSMPDTHIELLLNPQEKDVYEFYKISFLTFNNEHTIKCNLHSELYPNEKLVDEISKESWSSYFIPILLKTLKKELKDKNLGLYQCTLRTLGFLYAQKQDYNSAFNFIAYSIHLMVHGAQNNMSSLDLRLLPDDDSYIYVDYSNLIRIFFLTNPCLPIDFEMMRKKYVSIPTEKRIIHRFSTEETFTKIVDLIKKYI